MSTKGLWKPAHLYSLTRAFTSSNDTVLIAHISIPMEWLHIHVYSVIYLMTLSQGVIWCHVLKSNMK